VWPVALLQLPSLAQIAAVAQGASPIGLGYWIPLATPPRPPERPLQRRTAREAPSSEEADLLTLLNPDGPADERLAALDHAVDRVDWFPRRAGVRHALRRAAERDGCDVSVVKRRELRAAVYLVLAERWRWQTHRFGARWLTGENGRVQEILPGELPPDLFWRWFADEVRKAAETALLGEPYPLAHSEPRTQPLEEQDAARLVDPRPDPLEALIRKHERREHAARWQRVLSGATPGQRRLLRALTFDPAGAAPVTLGDAAARLGLAASTARVQWKRLVDRYRGS
jgi:hypothetical protein